MSSKVIIELEVKAIIPIIEAFCFYFNSKYPCTDETNDGSNMTLEDELKYATYNHLLGLYEKNKDLFQEEYDSMKKAVS